MLRSYNFNDPKTIPKMFNLNNAKNSARRQCSNQKKKSSRGAQLKHFQIIFPEMINQNINIKSVIYYSRDCILY